MTRAVHSGRLVATRDDHEGEARLAQCSGGQGYPAEAVRSLNGGNQRRRPECWGTGEQRGDVAIVTHAEDLDTHLVKQFGDLGLVGRRCDLRIFLSFDAVDAREVRRDRQPGAHHAVVAVWTVRRDGSLVREEDVEIAPLDHRSEWSIQERGGSPTGHDDRAVAYLARYRPSGIGGEVVEHSYVGYAHVSSRKSAMRSERRFGGKRSSKNEFDRINSEFGNSRSRA